jgi:hypothetical protein
MGLPHHRLAGPRDLAAAMKGDGEAGGGIRIAELCTDRAAGTALRARLRRECGQVILATC